VNRPRVYVAHPIATYGTSWSARGIEAVARAWPDAEVIDPAVCFDSNEAWLDVWPQLVATLSALVVVGDEQGRIGAGCLREIADAILWSVPTYTLAERRGVLGQAVLCGMTLPEHPSPQVAAILRAGRDKGLVVVSERERWQLLPELSGGKYDALNADIAAHGSGHEDRS
jgi:hypothetical protein